MICIPESALCYVTYNAIDLTQTIIIYYQANVYFASLTQSVTLLSVFGFYAILNCVFLV